MSDDKWVYKVEDIFEDIEGDEENVLMNIPPEIAERAGFKEGDVLVINKDPDGHGIIIKKKE